VKPLIA
jgi:signal transduction histidine kinase